MFEKKYYPDFLLCISDKNFLVFLKICKMLSRLFLTENPDFISFLPKSRDNSKVGITILVFRHSWRVCWFVEFLCLYNDSRLSTCFLI